MKAFILVNNLGLLKKEYLTLFSTVLYTLHSYSPLHSLLCTPISILHSPLSFLYSLLSTFYSPLTTHTLSFTHYTLTFHSTLYSPLSIIYSLLSSLYSLLSTHLLSTHYSEYLTLSSTVLYTLQYQS